MLENEVLGELDYYINSSLGGPDLFHRHVNALFYCLAITQIHLHYYLRRMWRIGKLPITLHFSLKLRQRSNDPFQALKNYGLVKYHVILIKKQKLINTGLSSAPE